jgi:hypothetical protein
VYGGPTLTISTGAGRPVISANEQSGNLCSRMIWQATQRFIFDLQFYLYLCKKIDNKVLI